MRSFPFFLQAHPPRQNIIFHSLRKELRPCTDCFIITRKRHGRILDYRSPGRRTGRLRLSPVAGDSVTAPEARMGVPLPEIMREALQRAEAEGASRVWLERMNGTTGLVVDLSPAPPAPCCTSTSTSSACMKIRCPSVRQRLASPQGRAATTPISCWNAALPQDISPRTSPSTKTCFSLPWTF